MLLSHPDRLRNTDPGQSGFTLLEVVVAISVLAIGLLGLASFLVSTTHQREEIVVGNRVLNEAESLMETILAVTPHSIQTMFDEEGHGKQPREVQRGHSPRGAGFLGGLPGVL